MSSANHYERMLRDWTPEDVMVLIRDLIAQGWDAKDFDPVAADIAKLINEAGGLSHKGEQI